MHANLELLEQMGALVQTLQLNNSNSTLAKTDWPGPTSWLNSGWSSHSRLSRSSSSQRLRLRLRLGGRLGRSLGRLLLSLGLRLHGSDGQSLLQNLSMRLR